MSQNDYIIANQSAPDFRSDLNDALQALASLSSGSSAPSTTYANMLWYDDANNILKMRTEADDAWINVGYLDQSSNAFRILDDTQVVNTSGTQTGLLGDQTTATWEAGTGTTASLVSPENVKSAVDSFALGVGQTWQDVKALRVVGTSYQNTTGKPIFVSISTGTNSRVQVSNNGSAWITLSNVGAASSESATTFVVPDDGYYRMDIGTVRDWVELR